MTTTWAKAYLVKIYTDVMQHGSLEISPISESQAKSLTQAIYRLRRRSDTSNASFITPQHHLVTCGKWTPDNGGTLPIMYAIPDNYPTITPTGDGVPNPPSSTTKVPKSPQENSDAILQQLEAEPIDPKALVKSLRSSAKARNETEE